MRRRVTNVIGNLCERQLFLYIFFHIVNSRSYKIVFGGFVFCGVSTLLQVSLRAKEGEKYGTWVKHIFAAIAHFVRTENFFK